MKTGRYSLRELLTHNEIDQVIIPEIQRDYVWQQINAEGLLTSIRDHFASKQQLEFSAYVDEERPLEPHLLSYLKKEYERLIYHVKIGFIYAYHDLEYAGKFFLIDGQQRLTTLYLLLLALYKKTGREQEFRAVYFKNGQLKIDYKVREASHDFMAAFVRNELKTGSRDIKLSNAYYKNYDLDTTISNLISNYGHLQRQIDRMEEGDLIAFTNFIEEFVEVNYFDTSLSEQGEQLYLYMNSRGEELSFQERIKSEVILKEETAEGKKTAGHEWENWQNFFWQHRYYWIEQRWQPQENADVGFQEFLKWATILQVSNSDIKRPEDYVHRNSVRLAAQADMLKAYQLSSPAFTFGYLRRLADALSFLYDPGRYESFKNFLRKSYLANYLQTIDYIIICPLLYFTAYGEWSDADIKQQDIIRMGMFLKNISYFSGSVGKTPDTATIDLLKMVKILCDLGLTDVTGFLDPAFDKKFRYILTEQELKKLRLLQAQEGEVTRHELEAFIWKITDDRKLSTFVEGNISILFDCVAADIERLTRDQFTELVRYYPLLQHLVADHFKFDITRRAILTFGDYALPESGGTYQQEYISKYSFVSDAKEWRQLFASDGQKLFFIAFMKSLFTNLATYEAHIVQAYFQALIDGFTDIDDWRYAFIRFPQIMEYCQQKKILYKNDHKIILLSKTIMSADYCELPLMAFIAGYDGQAGYKNRTCHIDKDPKTLLVVYYQHGKWLIGTENKDECLLTTPVVFFEDHPTLSIMANVELALSAFRGVNT